MPAKCGGTKANAAHKLAFFLLSPLHLLIETELSDTCKKDRIIEGNSILSLTVNDTLPINTLVLFMYVLGICFRIIKDLAFPSVELLLTVEIPNPSFELLVVKVEVPTTSIPLHQDIRKSLGLNKPLVSDNHDGRGEKD